MTADPDWALYRTLLAVIEDGSLSGAARRLGLTQPTVARHVDALEAALGSDLFVRSQRGLAPTELALALRPHAEIMGSTAAALLRTASGAAGAVAGTVRISASEVVGVEYLPPVLTRLRREHPQLVIELTLTDRVDDLLRREADIAVRNTEPTQGALVARRLNPVDLGFHGHRDYFQRRGVPTTLADLGGHDLIGFDAETPALRAMLVHLPGLDRSSFALRTDNNLAQLAAIRAGFGIGLCHVTMAQADPMLARVLDTVAFALPLWIVMHEDLKTNARYRVVFDGLVAALQGIARLDAV
ncbi:LysR family transcriptional regulator [Sphingomonas sp. 10B4]|uniref:LysR family transcriptional regulator n=1 Tax=Sphingomonas sp. 10B4 TaxID=3048575 RepID=UPI002AB4EDC8|nr:LysR family transcriptional regulator [Sphingomonas sp. 10B4]MDY7526237.1 LysR family transcriptional regulator [Sphingomonas sp. 10B4]MEB0283489.1 LysR family transcriptional regulator [Sphingomonas sp. 10B4]